MELQPKRAGWTQVKIQCVHLQCIYLHNNTIQKGNRAPGVQGGRDFHLAHETREGNPGICVGQTHGGERATV